MCDCILNGTHFIADMHIDMVSAHVYRISYVIVDIPCKVCDSKRVGLIRQWFEVVRVLAVLVMKLLQQR